MPKCLSQRLYYALSQVNQLSLTEIIVSLVSMFAACISALNYSFLYTEDQWYSQLTSEMRLKLSMCGRIKERK